MPYTQDYVDQTVVPALQASTAALTPRTVARFSAQTKALLSQQYRELMATLALDGGTPSLAEQLANGIANGPENYPSKAIEAAVDALMLTWGRIGAQYQITTKHEQRALEKLKAAVNLAEAYEAISTSSSTS